MKPGSAALPLLALAVSTLVATGASSAGAGTPSPFSQQRTLLRCGPDSPDTIQGIATYEDGLRLELDAPGGKAHKLIIPSGAVSAPTRFYLATAGDENVQVAAWAEGFEDREYTFANGRKATIAISALRCDDDTFDALGTVVAFRVVGRDTTAYPTRPVGPFYNKERKWRKAKIGGLSVYVVGAV